MSEIEIHHLSAAYALDALDDVERAAFEAHFAHCELCRVEVREFRATATELATLTATAPPASLRERVMAEIATTRQLSPLPAPVVRLDDRRRRLVPSLLAAAAAVVLVVAAALLVGGGGTDFDAELAAMIADPTSQTVRLSGDGDGTFSVTWRDGEAAVVASGLPDPGDGNVYELWLIDGSGAHPMRLLDGAAGGDLRGLVEFGAGADPLAWGVTIEPAAGSDVPTEPVLYVASLA